MSQGIVKRKIMKRIFPHSIVLAARPAAVWALLPLLFFPAEALGQERPSVTAPPTEKSQNDNRERWKSLPPERQKEIQKLFELLRELPPAERKMLLERLRAMSPGERRQALERARGHLDPLEGSTRELRRDLIRRHLEGLPAEEKERLRRLSPEERREFLEKRFSERREKILSRLPPELREKAAKMPPQQQVEFLRRLRGEQLFKETFKDSREIDRLRSLPPGRLREVLRVPADGSPQPKPRFFSDEAWKRWLELKPFERLRVLRFLIESKASSRWGSEGEGSPGRGGRPDSGQKKPEAASPEAKSF